MEVPDERLRAALEVAFVVAVARTRQRPPVPAPVVLRPFLRFQKLPNAALTPVRRAVEDDEAFRLAVASVATEELVDRVGWLWLHRPTAWEDELGALLEVDGPDAEAAGAEAPRATDRVGTGRLEAAEARARRLAAELELARQEVARSRDAIARADAEATRARARADELERGLERSRARLERAERERDERQARLEVVDRERDAARSARKHEAVPAPPVALAAPGAISDGQHVSVMPGTDRVGGDDGQRTPAAPPDPPAPAAGHPGREDQGADAGATEGAAPVAPLPPAALDALDGAATAAAALASALAGLAASLSVGSATISSLPATPFQPVLASPPGARARPRRAALRLPRGLREGTAEGDAWLLTEAGAAVVVDGYNVAKLAWPGEPLPEQRERLLRVLDDLVCRHHASVQVIFDGADTGSTHGGREHRIAVRFSPASVSADDVIRDVVRATPVAQPVVVVTNDAEIVRDVRALGANVVSSDGLLRVARR